MGFLALFPSRFEMRSSNSAKKLSLDSSKWAAAETLLNVRKSYISEAASRKTGQNVMTYRKIPWQLDIDSFSLPNYQGISYFCYCLSGCNETVWSCNQISIQLLLLFIEKQISWAKQIQLFQYNSCYCLSGVQPQYWIDGLIFQYNSCYCLSYTPFLTKSLKWISIQLLLLFIQKKQN